ncbi:MAG: hypothetical protein ACON4O_03825 [Lentimonas sp.]
MKEPMSIYIPNTLVTTKKILLLAMSIVAMGHASAQLLVDYQFNDSNGTNLNAAAQNGTITGSWDFGSAQVQTPGSGDQAGIGTLNYGYTSNYKLKLVDGSAGTNVFRKYSFDTPLTTGTAVLEVVFSKWDVRQNWDPDNASATGKGIQFSLLSESNAASVRFETQGSNGFRAVGSGIGATQSQLNGGDFDNSLNRFEANGGRLLIETDLDTGIWIARASDGEGGSYKTVVSGSGLFSIDSIRYNAHSPSVGAWGGAGAGTATDPNTGGVSGDYFLIDSLTLTAVPEQSAFATIAGMIVLGFSIVGRRR